MRVMPPMIALAVLAPSWAADKEQSPAPAPTAANQGAANMDEVICKKFPAPTGSRLGARRVCDTRRNWEQMEHDSQDALTHIQDRSMNKPPP